MLFIDTLHDQHFFKKENVFFTFFLHIQVLNHL